MEDDAEYYKSLVSDINLKMMNMLIDLLNWIVKGEDITGNDPNDKL